MSSFLFEIVENARRHCPSMFWILPFDTIGVSFGTALQYVSTAMKSRPKRRNMA